MLRQLQIESYGLIERADVDFADGATIFTGETGSGKTMLLGALDFALGGRAGADVVRRGAAKAVVTLVFDPDDSLRRRLAADGFEIDPGELGTIVREMSESGRSSVRVNGRASTASYARELREAIAEIVGQHEAQRLLAAAYHLDLLDRFAGDAALRAREAVAAAFAREQQSSKALAELTADERRARERYDDAIATVRDVDEARIEPGEIDRLTDRRGYLDNVERIAGALHAAREAFAADERGATGALGAAAAALSSVAKYDGELDAMARRALAMQSDVRELAGDVASALDAAEYDPAELEAINARLDLIERLKRRYGGTLEDIVAAARDARTIVDDFENRDQRVSEVAATVQRATEDLHAAAVTLSTLRQKAAAALGKRVVKEFGDIALASGRFEVAFEPLERVSAQGAERLEFLFAANAGEPARALTRVVSGGELSRVLLALVVVLAGARDAQAGLVFDEIDAGIGGATAAAVGVRIGALAKRGQVVCVTHLAQIATWADRHYVLEKLERKRETTIVVRELCTQGEREGEIARMLSGESHDVAVRHARALLQTKKRAATGSGES